MNPARDPRLFVALSGGVGGAKLAAGLAKILPPAELLIVGNTGDDFEHLGLHIAPDLDSLTYALAGLNDEKRGWGRRDETWHFLAALGELGGETWFRLGDRDLALHVVRTVQMRSGRSLSAATRAIAARFGIGHRILPMSDDPVRTVIDTTEGKLNFQDYFVRKACLPKIKAIWFEGASAARMHTELCEAFASPSLAGVFICPSNPYISVDPILAIPGMRPALESCAAPVIAVSPIVGGAALKGPVAKMMEELGYEPSVVTVSRHYEGLVDGLVIDPLDGDKAEDVEATGLRPLIVPTVMSSDAVKIALAQAVIDFADSWAGGLVSGRTPMPRASG